jgi:cell division protein ZapA (FtsZ GTPase activity inhibitor)
MGVDVVAEKYEIKIAGKTFLIGSDRGESHVKGVADYVEQRMREIGSVVHTADSMRIALMTALTLAEEVLDSERRNGFR